MVIFLALRKFFLVTSYDTSPDTVMDIPEVIVTMISEYSGVISKSIPIPSACKTLDKNIR